ncbi:SCAR-like protein 2 isoform X1 [Amborella trichopoda]|uniref:Protein SCAR n=2 Tax=Amborella trichopoda TaxID=13333 RepID=W1Q0Y6_AMBTC|nr:SCAR-like protein 2 isoform X1 [Amborella trichopoda]ERN13890.1 hypothetical protein AMTR_s00021p00061660 [Amborella trichopoda]|eukprot:XP_006852423.1 SCAR-like protein 2 isoform X1 [Amborella trichopoda]
MPLVRYQVRNEYGLGDPEIYRSAKKDDSPALLEGVAVAGLVGILRQLGDLAEFAVEIFHDLHEQVMAVAARGHNMMIRLEYLEAEIPSVEKSILSKKTHIQCAYSKGSEWHTQIQIDQNHLTRGDLPRFIMDAYEECRGPPRLYLLDRFDTGGSGACLKRYSDPSFFKKKWVGSELMKAEKFQKEKKAHRNKKKAQHERNGEDRDVGSISQHNASSRCFSSLETNEKIARTERMSTPDMKLKPQQVNGSRSVELIKGTGSVRPIFGANSPPGLEEPETNLSATPSLKIRSFGRISTSTPSTLSLELNQMVAEDNRSSHESVHQESIHDSVMWEEKTEVLIPEVELAISSIDASESLLLSGLEERPSNYGNGVDQVMSPSGHEEGSGSQGQSDGTACETDTYMDARATMDSDTEMDPPCKKEGEMKLLSSLIQGFSPNGDSFRSLGSPMRTPPDDHEVPLGTGSACSHTPSNHDTSNSQYLACEGPTQTSASGFSENCISESFSDIVSVRLWTNGGLLGLEPAKPMNIGNAGNQAPNASAMVTTNNAECSSQDTDSTSMAHSTRAPLEEQTRNPGRLIECPYNFRPNMENRGNREDFVIKQKCQEDLALQLELKQGKSFKPSNNQLSNGSEENFVDASVVSSKAELQNSSSFEGKSSADHTEQSDDLVSKAHVKTNLVKFQGGSLRIDPATSSGNTNSKVLANDKFWSLQHSFSSKAGYNGPPSPPLEHMKISFHPMNGSSTSQFKLSFPDGHRFGGRIKDLSLCPSLSLSDPAVPLHDASETESALDLGVLSLKDQETQSKIFHGDSEVLKHADSEYDSEDYSTEEFHKRSPGFSVNLISQESESESWICDDTNGSKDERYDGLCRVSSDTSISSSLGLDGTSSLPFPEDCEFGGPYGGNGNRSPFSMSSSSVELLANLGTVNSTLVPESKDLRYSEPESSVNLASLQEISLNLAAPESIGYETETYEMPPPPPLPPVEWRTMKTPLPGLENKQETAIHASTIASMHTPDIKTVPQSEEGIAKGALMAALNSNGKSTLKKHEASVQPPRSEPLDERTMLLEQIRTKSFSLRRTTTARPNLSPGPTTNINVAAILEKANAIRQAFAGSDDGGDDDNWSDA